MNPTKFYIVLLIFTTQIVYSQQGPIVACVNCEQLSARTEPMNGLWYNPEQSGTGYSIEVQNGKVFGVYYGYDNDTKPTWLTFQADLVPSDDPEIMWTFDADLLQFEGGNCMNCDYTPPNTTDFESTIHIDFKHKNYASMSVNDGEVQNLVPLVYGVPVTADFPEQTSYRLPELRGMWSFVFKLNSEVYPSFPNQWGYSSVMVQIYDKGPILDLDNNGNQVLRYNVQQYAPPPEIAPFGGIECGLGVEENDPSQLTCIFNFELGLFGEMGVTNVFHMTLGGLGSKRLFGETLDGHTFEAFKVNSTEYQSR